MTAKLHRVFEPVKIGRREAKNRFAFTPHETSLAENSMPKERYARYHAERAKGGAGLVMTFGSCSVHPSSPVSGGGVAAWKDEIIPHLQRFAELVHEHDALLVSQISHRGRRGASGGTERPLLAPSPIAEPFHRETPRELTHEEIEELIAAFAAAAVRFQKGGFDGVEVNSYGGQLIEQFWTPSMNHRADEWGGSLENRMRFGKRVVSAVREAVGLEFIVGFRMTGDQLVQGGLDTTDLQQIASLMDQVGVIDYFSVSGSVGTTASSHAALVPSMDFPHAVYAEACGAIREVVSAPVIYAGRITTPFEAEEVLEKGQADIVAMTRAMIADPHMVNKARDGRLGDIRPCVGANEGCIGRQYFGLPISCVHNPSAGREIELASIRASDTKKHVVIVGGGPAGLEAARVAGMRGHRVTLFEKSTQLGGQVLVAAKAPHRSEYGEIASWLERQVRDCVEDIRMNTVATTEAILELQPDAVIVATGSVPRRPEIPGADLPHVITADQILLDETLLGKNFVVLDDDAHLRGPGAAEKIAQAGKKVTIVSRLWTIGEAVDGSLKPPLYQRLLSNGVTMIPNELPIGIGASWVELENVFSGEKSRLSDVDVVVIAYGGVANNRIHKQLDGKITELYLIGDANAPRRLHDAMLEATRTARLI